MQIMTTKRRANNYFGKERVSECSQKLRSGCGGYAIQQQQTVSHPKIQQTKKARREPPRVLSSAGWAAQWAAGRMDPGFGPGRARRGPFRRPRRRASPGRPPPAAAPPCGRPPAPGFCLRPHPIPEEGTARTRLPPGLPSETEAGPAPSGPAPARASPAPALPPAVVGGGKAQKLRPHR